MPHRVILQPCRNWRRMHNVWRRNDNDPWNKGGRGVFFSKQSIACSLCHLLTLYATDQLTSFMRCIWAQATSNDDCDCVDVSTMKSADGIECISCSEGGFASVAGGVCSDCPPGRFQDASAHIFETCSECPAGRYRTQVGGREVGDCSVCGQFSSSIAGSNGTADCVCPTQSISDSAGNGDICACQVGYYMDSVLGVCLACPVGSFSATTGSIDACEACATDGTQTTASGTTVSSLRI